jgi:thiol-disulfide isomerase/thioredoxin
MRGLVTLLVIATACGHAAPPTTPPAKQDKIVQMNAPGEVVDIEAGLAAGYVTVVDFWSESCGACHVVGEMLEKGVATEPKILIRKVDVGDAFTPVAAHYDIGALPHYRIYDKRGRMRYQLVGNDCIRASEIARELLAEP